MRVIFCRHAKTEDTHPEGDHARRLTQPGHERAREVGPMIRELGVDHAFVSTATRTRETFDELGLDCPVEHLDDLYNASVDGVARALAESGVDAPWCALVVGHNPSMQAWVHALCVAAGAAEADAVAGSFPTAAFGAFDVTASWEAFTAGQPGEVSLVALHLR